MIEQLIPQVGAQLQLLLDAMKASGHPMRVTSTVRTWAQQTALYNQGRSTKGKRVTDAKAGESFHNYAVAADLCFEGADPWADKNPALWDLYGKTAQQFGFEWGGSWPPPAIKDRPHVQMAFGMSVFALKAMGEAAALDLLRRKAAEAYPAKPAAPVWPKWALPALEAAKKFGYTDQNPDEVVGTIRDRHFWAKHPRYKGFIEDKEEPVTYKERLTMCWKAGDFT